MSSIWLYIHLSNCKAVLCCSLTKEEANQLIAHFFPPPPPRIPIGSVVRLRDGLLSEGPLQAGQMAVITTDDGSANPYRVRTADGVEHSNWFFLDYLVKVDDAAAVHSHRFVFVVAFAFAATDACTERAESLCTRSNNCKRCSVRSENFPSFTPISVLQAEYLATVKQPPARIPVGTVVRIADGLETCGPLRAGQTAITIAEDGSSNPYRVRTADGEEHSYWFELDKLVEADAAASVSCQRARGSRQMW